MKSIDLNCDVGELPGAIEDGTQEQLMRFISSASIACGGHAGDPQMMRATIEQALRHRVHIGAHPGYEDCANFGRTELQLSAEQIAESVHRQILALQQIANRCRAVIHHVKAHGALYNQAARSRAVARAVADGVRRSRADVILVGLAGSVMLEEFRAGGFPVAAEAFADRRYENDGTLRSRQFAESLLSTPEEAAAQALRIVEQSSVIAADGSVVPLVPQTICIHGDTRGAIEIATAVHHRLTDSGIAIQPMLAIR
jgi:5-oxoprolinase (ATP-hydrolysing) subunit A